MANPRIQTQWMSAGSQYNLIWKFHQATLDLNLALRYRYAGFPTDGFRWQQGA